MVFCGDGGGGHFRGVTPGQRESLGAAPVLPRGDREQFVNALEALVQEVLEEQVAIMMMMPSIKISKGTERDF